jgi:DNA-binding transcriptional LysR family regulator
MIDALAGPKEPPGRRHATSGLALAKMRVDFDVQACGGKGPMKGRVSDADVKLLRVFTRVVEHGGFSAAQAELGISQASISTYMSDLEARLGVRLCQRGRSGFQLTPAGEQVYRAALDLFSAHDQFRSNVGFLREGLRGRLTVGLTDTVATNLSSPIHRALESFLSRENDVSLTLHVYPPNELESGVLEGRFDLAIGTFYQRASGLKYEDLFVERNFLYCGARHPLFSRTDIALDELAHTVRVTRGYNPDLQQEILGPAGNSAIIYNMDAAALLTLSGPFIGFLPAHFGDLFTDKKVLRRLRDDSIWFDATFAIITRRGIQHSAVVETLISDLRSGTDGDALPAVLAALPA